jgi:hypothetical protein
VLAAAPPVRATAPLDSNRLLHATVVDARLQDKPCRQSVEQVVYVSQRSTDGSDISERRGEHAHEAV